MKHNTVKAIVDMLADESTILEEFRNFEGRTNPKKVRKFAMRLLREWPNLTQLQRDLLTDVAVAKNPAKTADEFISRIDDCAIIMEDLVAQGNHGMIMIGNSVYPIKLDTMEHWLDPEKPWDIEDERVICVDAGRNLMTEKGWVHLHGKALLFPHFGFTGIPREIELRRTNNTEGLIRHPGTRYYKRPIK